MERTIRLLAAMLALASGCGQTSPVKVSVTLIETEAGVDAPSEDGAAVPNAMGRCCAMAVPIVDAGRTGDAAMSLPTDNCSVLARHSLGVVEPCSSADGGAGFGAWTCGTGSPAARCADNGLSCNLGDPCTLLDVGCPGVVQACTFAPYTPPPG